MPDEPKSSSGPPLVVLPPAASIPKDTSSEKSKKKRRKKHHTEPEESASRSSSTSSSSSSSSESEDDERTIKLAALQEQVSRLLLRVAPYQTFPLGSGSDPMFVVTVENGACSTLPAYSAARSSSVR